MGWGGGPNPSRQSQDLPTWNASDQETSESDSAALSLRCQSAQGVPSLVHRGALETRIFTMQQARWAGGQQTRGAAGMQIL